MTRAAVTVIGIYPDLHSADFFADATGGRDRSIESITIRRPCEFLKLVRHYLLFQAASIFASQRS